VRHFVSTRKACKVHMVQNGVHGGDVEIDTSEINCLLVFIREPHHSATNSFILSSCE
jgi:hypothetical protein